MNNQQSIIQLQLQYSCPQSSALPSPGPNNQSHNLRHAWRQKATWTRPV